MCVQRYAHTARAMSATTCVDLCGTLCVLSVLLLYVPIDALHMSNVLCVCVARYIQINMSTKQARSND